MPPPDQPPSGEAPPPVSVCVTFRQPEWTSGTVEDARRYLTRLQTALSNDLTDPLRFSFWQALAGLGKYSGRLFAMDGAPSITITVPPDVAQTGVGMLHPLMQRDNLGILSVVVQ